MISGKGASGNVNGNLIAGCHTWKFNEKAVELDNATAANGGFENPEAGLIGGTVTLSVWYDVGLSAYTPIDAGSPVSNLNLRATAAGGNMVSIPSGVVLESEIGAEVRGKIEATHTIKTKGAYTTNETVVP